MVTRVIAREARLAVALEGLAQSRSRSKQLPATLLERQPRDHRTARRNSAEPQAVLATVAALSAGEGVRGARTAAGYGYYTPGGPGGGFGGGGEAN